MGMNAGPQGFQMTVEEGEGGGAHAAAETELFQLVAAGNVDKVTVLLKERGAGAGGYVVDEADDSGMTLLIKAADGGDESMVAALLNLGANVNLVDQDGMTALHTAALCDHAAIAELLVKAGADVTLECDDETALDMCESKALRATLEAAAAAAAAAAAV